MRECTSRRGHTPFVPPPPPVAGVTSSRSAPTGMTRSSATLAGMAFTTEQWRAKAVEHLEAAEAALSTQQTDFTAKGEVARSHALQASAILAALTAKII